VLLVHETHRVVGVNEEEFESAFRTGWMPALGAGGDARLLWYATQAHGSGASYTCVTVTALRDASTWADLDHRLRNGDLKSWAAHVDALRHGVEAKVLVPVPWSPLQSVAFDAVPTSPGRHEVSLFMEDTVWPYAGGLDPYLQKAGRMYAQTLAQSRLAGQGLLAIEGAFRPFFGSHRPNEVVLWQRVLDYGALVGLLTEEAPASLRAPGTWMHDALSVRDRWESRLLRAAAWSPWY
jgi:hypothetical protein